MTTKRELQVENWNLKHPVGTPVIVTRDRGATPPTLETKTTSEAWVMGGHTPVIMVDGISGAYALDRVRPA